MRKHVMFNMMEKCCLQPCCQSMAGLACSDSFSIFKMTHSAA